MKTFRILAINPGSTSTKIALYDNDVPVFIHTIRHRSCELSVYSSVASQFVFRRDLILDTLRENKIDVASISAVIGRGGLIRPIPSGVYRVDEQMKDDLRSGKFGEHASNLGGLIAAEIASANGIEAYIADPVVVDELEPVARVSGVPGIERRSIFHALNQKAVARRFAASEGRPYEEMNMIVAHLGGGISVGAHKHGRVVDVNNALDGEGPISPERAGTLPAGQLAALCREMAYEEVKNLLTGKGGFVAHLGTNDTSSVVAKALGGDAESALILDAMCYGVGKSIGSMAAVLEGKVDAIILTGSIAYNECICDRIRSMTSFIAPVVVMAGEDEMGALALNALNVLQGRTEPASYS